MRGDNASEQWQEIVRTAKLVKSHHDGPVGEQYRNYLAVGGELDAKDLVNPMADSQILANLILRLDRDRPEGFEL